MTITSISSSTFVADTVNYIRDRIKAQSLTGVGTRVYTSYPKRGVTYPMITIVDGGISQPGRLGMGSQGAIITLPLEIRIWARNVKERDELFDSIYAQYLLSPSVKLNDAEGYPLPVTVVTPDLTQVIDFTTNADVDGPFGGGFGIRFDRYES